MARIAGIDLPRTKRVEIGLTYIFGIGRPKANFILEKADVRPDTRVKDLSEEEVVRIRKVITDDVKVEGEGLEAKVTVTNEATNVSATATDSSTGTYVFPNLLVGTYTVSVEKAGDPPKDVAERREVAGNDHDGADEAEGDGAAGRRRERPERPERPEIHHAQP